MQLYCCTYGEYAMSNLLPVRYGTIIPLCLMCLLGILLCPGQAHAADLVSGRYVSSTGTKIVLSLAIQTPAVSNLIVEQYLSPGNNITATSPRAKKVTAGKGKCKWLFRNTRKGNITLTIQLNTPLKGSVYAMVRYRNPDSGKFQELQIKP